MLKSMTTFAREASSLDGSNWNTELKSVNQRYFELSLKLPHKLGHLEGQIREKVNQYIVRGKVFVNISEDKESAPETQYEISTGQVEHYLSSAQKMKRKFKLEGDLQVQDLLRLPGIIKEVDVSKKQKIAWKHFEPILTKLLEKAVAFRKDEGKKLETDIRKRLKLIAQAASKIEKSITEKHKKIFKKLQGRVNELLGDVHEGTDLDRLHREVAFLAEKSDVTEEIVRLNSHLELFDQKLKSNASVGRDLDFLCQELNREINTIASKAQHFEVAKMVIETKSEIEKIREQVQNIE